jgi:hypothetical protein
LSFAPALIALLKPTTIAIITTAMQAEENRMSDQVTSGVKKLAIIGFSFMLFSFYHHLFSKTRTKKILVANLSNDKFATSILTFSAKKMTNANANALNRL